MKTRPNLSSDTRAPSWADERDDGVEVPQLVCHGEDVAAQPLHRSPGEALLGPLKHRLIGSAMNKVWLDCQNPRV